MVKPSLDTETTQQTTDNEPAELLHVRNPEDLTMLMCGLPSTEPVCCEAEHLTGEYPTFECMLCFKRLCLSCLIAVERYTAKHGRNDPLGGDEAFEEETLAQPHPYTVDKYVEQFLKRGSGYSVTVYVSDIAWTDEDYARVEAVLDRLRRLGYAAVARWDPEGSFVHVGLDWTEAEERKYRPHLYE